MYCSMRWHARCCITDGLMIMGLSSPPGSLADKTTNIMVTIGWWWWWWWWWGSMDWAHPQEVLKTKEQSSALVSVVREADYRHQQSLIICLYLYLYLMTYFVHIFVFVFLSIAMYFVSWYKRQTIATTNRAGVNSHLHFAACHTTYCVMGELQQNGHILNPKWKCWTKTWAIWLMNWYHFNLWGIK